MPEPSGWTSTTPVDAFRDETLSLPPGVDWSVTADQDFAEVIRRELQLLEPAVRADKAAVVALLHPEFVEFGASGRKWDADAIAGALAAEAAHADVEVDALAPVRLGEDAVLLTYEATCGGAISLRSSVWLRHHGEWLMRFHQGTPFPAA